MSGVTISVGSFDPKHPKARQCYINIHDPKILEGAVAVRFTGDLAHGLKITQMPDKGKPPHGGSRQQHATTGYTVSTARDHRRIRIPTDLVGGELSRDQRTKVRRPMEINFALGNGTLTLVPFDLSKVPSYPPEKVEVQEQPQLLLSSAERDSRDVVQLWSPPKSATPSLTLEELGRVGEFFRKWYDPAEGYYPPQSDVTASHVTCLPVSTIVAYREAVYPPLVDPDILALRTELASAAAKLNAIEKRLNEMETQRAHRRI